MVGGGRGEGGAHCARLDHPITINLAERQPWAWRETEYRPQGIVNKGAKQAAVRMDTDSVREELYVLNTNYATGR